MTISAGFVPAPAQSSGAKLVGRYELLYEIASGGMATVYLARARGVANFERVVAIKVCHPHLRKDEDFSAMFLDEARLAARIHHPNVVSALEVGDEDILYLVMEFVEGDKLSSLIRAASKKHVNVPVPIAVRMMIETLEGLHAAHELKDPQGNALNIVHRDVSPQNILVGADGVTRITDFGIAKAEARITQTREGQIKGKMSYMAPEQLASNNVTRRADIYAAGVVLWESLTGRRLFRAESDAETLNMVLHGVVVKPSDVVPGIPPELDACVLKALERDPEKRYTTAAEFAAALEEGGFKVATTRAVAAYVHEMLGATIEEKRGILRKIAEGGPIPLADRPDISHSAVRLTANATSTNATLPAMALALGASPTEPAGPMGAPGQDPSRSRTTLLVVLLCVTILALISATVLAFRNPGRDPSAHLRAPVRVEIPRPSPPELVPAPVQTPTPVAPQVAPQAAPPPAEEPVPVIETPSQVATNEPAHGSHRERPTRGGRRNAAQHTATPTGSQPPPAAPSQTPSGEYHPSAI